MRKYAPLGVDQTTFSSADASSSVDDTAFGSNYPCFGRERSHERNLELKCRLTKPFFQRGVDSEPHARIEQRSRETAMDSAGRIEVRGGRARQL